MDYEREIPFKRAFASGSFDGINLDITKASFNQYQ